MNILGLSKSYDQKTVLDCDELALEEGIAHGLLGANGAGKSTLIKIIMDLVHADKGSVKKPKSVALLPENPYLPSNLTAFQIVRYACQVQNCSNMTENILKEVRLKEDAWHKQIRTYSKGMKQRTAIAYSLAGQPEWLLLDEPMSGLDAMGRKQMLDVFEKKKNSGMSILMCSHAVTDLVRLCEKVHIMANGKVCETYEIKERSMGEAEGLEERLNHWSGDYALD